MTIGVDEVLWVEMPGLSSDQVKRALAAAHASLKEAGVDPEEAYEASWKPELIEFDSKARMTKRELALLRNWYEAIDAAQAATGVGRGDAYLQLFPASVGAPRRSSSLEALATGRALAVYPPPDPGPLHRFPVPGDN